MSTVDDRASHLAQRHDAATAAAADGRYDESVDLLRRLVRDRPDLVVPRRNLVRVLVSAGRHWDAVDAGRSALIDHPDDRPLARLLGDAAHRTGQHRIAAEAARQLVRTDPADAGAHRRLVTALRRFADGDEVGDAVRAWAAVAPDDPSVRHFLGVYDGHPAERANDDYVRLLFDGYAPTFDDHLASLGYRAPRAIADRLLQLDIGQVGVGVDLGCGTGLVGEVIRPMVGELIGVDLSSGMLARARDRGVYDHLIEMELTAYLADHVERFDLIVAADTLIYVGALRPVFAAARSALRAGGVLVFSAEASEDRDRPYVLHDSGRYAHCPRHLVNELERSGFVDITSTSEMLRQEGRRPVDGRIVTARRPEVDHPE